MRIGKQKGFTLVELIVVIIVIAILAVFIMPKFLSFDKSAAEAILDRSATTLKKATHYNKLAYNAPNISQQSSGAMKIDQNTTCKQVVNKFFPDRDSAIELVKSNGQPVGNNDKVGSNGDKCYFKYNTVMKKLKIILT